MCLRARRCIWSSPNRHSIQNYLCRSHAGAAKNGPFVHKSRTVAAAGYTRSTNNHIQPKIRRNVIARGVLSLPRPSQSNRVASGSSMSRPRGTVTFFPHLPYSAVPYTYLTLPLLTISIPCQLIFSLTPGLLIQSKFASPAP